MWARQEVVRRRRIAETYRRHKPPVRLVEHLPGKHSQATHGRGGKAGPTHALAKPGHRDQADALMRQMGLDPTTQRDTSWEELKDTFPNLGASSLDKMGNPATRREVIDTLNELGAKYPEAALQLTSLTVKRPPQPGMETTLAATNGLSEMRFIDSVFGPGGDFPVHQQLAQFAPGMYSGPLTARYVTAHEFGHVMAFRGAQRGTNARDWGRIAEVVPRSSAYGRESGDENLAELFAAYHTGGNLSSEQRGFVETMIRDVEGPASESVRDDHQASHLRVVSASRQGNDRGLAEVEVRRVPVRGPGGRRAIEGGAHPSASRGSRVAVRARSRATVAEHLTGKHDQRRHGRKGSGASPLMFGTSGAADAGLAAHYADWHGGLSSAEGQAFGDYSAVGYRPINGRLRQGHPLTAAQRAEVAALDSALSRAQAPPEGLVVYRGLKQKALPAPAWQMVGRTMTDDGFMSTSAAREVGGKFAAYAKDAGKAPVVIKITVRGGQKGVGAVTGAAKNKSGGRMQMDEAEILVKRGTTVKFTGFSVEKYTALGETYEFATLVGEMVE